MVAVHGGQEDRTLDMQVQVDTWRCRPLMIHVRVCAQRISATKTQWNLVCPGFSKPRADDGTKALIFRVGDLVVMQKRCLHTHGSWDIWSFVAHTSNTRTDTVPICFFCFLAEPHNCIFEDSAGHNGPARSRNTNLSALAFETMWSQPILIELLAVLLLLQTHMHFPSRNLSPFSLRTCLNSSWGHFDFTAQNVHEIWEHG